MTKRVLLNIRSAQKYQVEEQDEQIEFLTEGTYDYQDGQWKFSYEETELTGLAGTVTSFRSEGEAIILERTGTLTSRMVFVVGKEDQSLYDMGFGAMMIMVRTEHIQSELNAQGGHLKVDYTIVIEQETAGTITYDITITPK